MYFQRHRLLFIFAVALPSLAAGCNDDLVDSPDPVYLTCEDPVPSLSIQTEITGGEQQLLSVGAHSLMVPADALPQGQDVTFTLRQMEGPRVTVVVEAEPVEQFESDLVLTLGYGDRLGCTLLGEPVSDADQLQLYRIEDGEYLPRAEAPEGAVAGRTRTFSTFSIAR